MTRTHHYVTWAVKFRPDVQTWDSDLMFRLEFRLGNLQSRIEHWRLKILQALLGESSIQDWGFNIKGSLLDWRFSKKSWGIFNLQSWIEDFPTRVLENLQSSILDWRFSKKSPGGDAWRWGNATGWGHWAEPGSWAKVASAPKAWDWILSVLFNLHSEAIHAAWRNKKVCSSEGMWGIWDSSIRRSGASSVAWKQALRCLALCLGQR